MPSSHISCLLPHTLAKWPWPRQLNPHYAEVKAASDAWVESFHAFNPKAQAAFNSGNFSLLASLGYPSATKECLRAACDLMQLFFVFDEYSDVEDENTVHSFADTIMNAIRNPDKVRPPGESVLGEIARQFWVNARKVASEPAQQRFIQSFSRYCQSVVEQAADRDAERIRNVEHYFENRRDNIGIMPSLTILEFDMNLPDDVLSNPRIVELAQWTADLIILGNRAKGDDRHNVITVIMHQFNTDIDGAVDYVEKYHDQLVDQFLAHYKDLPSWGPEIDRDVERYVDGMGNWVCASESWNFESGRYFTMDALAIRESRMAASGGGSTAELDMVSK